jgi:hypothetical protein
VVILARLYLAPIALLSEREVKVVALETDPVLVGDLSGRRLGWKRGVGVGGR